MSRQDAIPVRASMQRLQEAAFEMHEIASLTELAEAIGESPQTLGNWGQRGVSKAGALKAERHLGLSARWILDGSGASSASGMANAEGIAGPSAVVRRLRALLMRVQPECRDSLGRQLQALAHAPDSELLAEQLQKALGSGRAESD